MPLAPRVRDAVPDGIDLAREDTQRSHHKMPTEQTDRKVYDNESTPKFPENEQEQPRSKSSAHGTDHRGHEQDRTAGEKDHRRRVDAGEARKHAR